MLAEDDAFPQYEVVSLVEDADVSAKLYIEATSSMSAISDPSLIEATSAKLTMSDGAAFCAEPWTIMKLPVLDGAMIASMASLRIVAALGPGCESGSTEISSAIDAGIGICGGGGGGGATCSGKSNSQGTGIGICAGM